MQAAVRLWSSEGGKTFLELEVMPAPHAVQNHVVIIGLTTIDELYASPITLGMAERKALIAFLQSVPDDEP